jgi:hypothetical protein
MFASATHYSALAKRRFEKRRALVEGRSAMRKLLRALFSTWSCGPETLVQRASRKLVGLYRAVASGTLMADCKIVRLPLDTGSR